MAFQVWVQDTEPTGAQALDEWYLPTTGQKWQRRNDGTAWIYKGQVDDPYDGRLTRGGPDAARTMSAAITGPAGLADPASPDFGGFPKRAGVNLQTQIELDALKNELYARSRAAIIDYFAANPVFSDVAANLAVRHGEIIASYTDLFAGVQIPLPTFKVDGLQAVESQVLGWHACWSRFMIHDNVVDAWDRYLELRHEASHTVKMVATSYHAGHPPPGPYGLGQDPQDGWPDIGSYQFGVSYFIIAAR